MDAYTLIHVLISLIGIGTGIVAFYGLLNTRLIKGWTEAFLISTAATTLTGFGFPFRGVTPPFIFGVLSTILLVLAIYARYGRSLMGLWRNVYVVTAMMALYLNVFVAVVQSFLKIPALQPLAPTQSEPPFVIMQALVLLLFICLTVVAVLRSRRSPGIRFGVTTV